MKPIVVQAWEETERGWGCRPDGFSLHLSVADCEAYRKKHWDDEKKLNAGGGVPDEYTRESGNPQLIDVEDNIYNKLVELKKNKKNGIRVWCRDIKAISKEPEFDSKETLANEKAKALDKQDEGSLHIWSFKEAPEAFRDLSQLDKCQWIAYVPERLKKQSLPFKLKDHFVLSNGSELHFI